jgi:hypothetical protein
VPVGASIFCLTFGAILTFAVETDSTEGINVNNVGIILMIAGAIGLAFYAMVWAPRRRVVTQRQVVEPVTQQRVVAQPVAPVATSQPVVERRVYES